MSRDVPPEFRVYIQSDEEEKYYRELGVTIYEGPRGGKYVDVREANRKVHEVSDEKSDVVLKKEADKILSNILSEKDRPVTGEEIAKLSEIYYKLNKKRVGKYAYLASGDIDDIVVKVEDFNVTSLNGAKMKKIYLKDGSVLYAKPVSNDELEPRWLPFNNVIGSRLLKLFSRGSEFGDFVPNISIVKVDDEIYVAAEEVYGILGGDVFDKKIRVSINENTIDFLVASILTGLWDVNFYNFMVIPDKGLIIPFDLDFIGNMQGEVFVGPVDSVALIRASGEINSEELLKRIISVYEQYNDSIEDIIRSIIDEYVDYLFDCGIDDYDYDDIVDNFMNWWNYIGLLIDGYKDGRSSAKDVIVALGSDGFKYGNMTEILKASKVPARYRIYINSWQAQRLRRNGVKVYRGPRGGLYVDSRDLRRKNISLEQEQEVGFVDNVVGGNVNLEEISREIVNPSKYMAVRGALSKRIDFLHERLIDYKLGSVSEEEYRRALMEAFDLSFVLNMGNKYRDNGNLMLDNLKVMDLKKAGVRAGVLNAGSMIVLEAPDGSKIFAKRVDEDAPEGVTNSLVVPTLLGVLVGDKYRGFVPVSRIIKRDDGVYIGLSEIYGLTFDDIYVRDIEFVKNDVLKLFLAAQYVMGLDDSIHNVFVDYKNGTVVQFDYDFAFMQRDAYANMHFSKLVDDIAGDDAEEIKVLGVNLLVENYSKLERMLGVLRQYVLLEVGDDSDAFNKAIDNAEEWIDKLYSLAREDVQKAVDFIEGRI